MCADDWRVKVFYTVMVVMRLEGGRKGCSVGSLGVKVVGAGFSILVFHVCCLLLLYWFSSSFALVVHAPFLGFPLKYLISKFATS